jgi:hypothetical protein
MKSCIALLSLLFFSFPSHAYLTLLDTGRVLPESGFRLGVGPQFITDSNNGSGANFLGRFDMGLTEGTALSAELGVGKVDFFAGGRYKWIPIPDIEGQPALGVLTGLYFARQNSVTTFSVRAWPIISKKFETGLGMFDPYGSIPLGFSATSDQSEFPVQAIGGTEWQPNGLEKISFFAEFGVNLSKAFSYFAILATLQFDEENGIQFR